jgi:hypothetical protein
MSLRRLAACAAARPALPAALLPPARRVCRLRGGANEPPAAASLPRALAAEMHVVAIALWLSD